jgi:hypothetical protein
MKPNPGYCPAEAAGKRVRVVLARDVGRDTPQTYDWPADGQGGCRWSITGDKHDVAKFEVIG